MALIKCKECGKEISSDATACPDCGKPINPPKSKSVSGIVIKVILTLIALGVLVFVVIPLTCAGVGVIGYNVNKRLGEAKKEETKIQIKNLESALKLFKLDNGFYPETLQGLEALIQVPSVGREPCCYIKGGYLDADQVPHDGWKSEFIYIGPDQTGDGSFEIISYGEDAVGQTEDDISSRNIR